MLPALLFPLALFQQAVPGPLPALFHPAVLLPRLRLVSLQVFPLLPLRLPLRLILRPAHRVLLVTRALLAIQAPRATRVPLAQAPALAPALTLVLAPTLAPAPDQALELDLELAPAMVLARARAPALARVPQPSQQPPPAPLVVRPAQLLQLSQDLALPLLSLRPSRLLRLR